MTDAKSKFKNPFKNLHLDPEEQELSRSIEAGEWKPVKNVKREMAHHRAIARHTLVTMKKNKNINIRLSELTILQLKTKAAIEGLPYQTLVGSILHKYVNGTL